MANTVAQKKTGTPPINADPPVLGPTKYPGPQGRPVRPVRKRPIDVASWVQGSKRPPRSGGKPPQGPEQGTAVGTWENPDYDKVQGDWGNSETESGGRPQMTDWSKIPYTPNQSDQIRAGGIGGDISMGMKDPRAGGLNKRTGEWTPPDPAYLEGLKNGTIEPEWKRRERMWNANGEYGGINPGGRLRQQPPGYGTDIKGMPGQGGEQVPGGYAIGGPKPVYSNSGGGTLGSQNGGTVGGGPVGGGAPGRPGRQPLRPGMEYRPGGGQRPVGGGMQGAPQDGGQSQVQGNYENWLGEGGVDPRGYQSDVYNAAQDGGVPGQMDPQEQMRRKLMLMQKQGPNGNPYYGAF